MFNRVTLTTFDNAIEANIVKGLLESEDIAAFLVGEQFFSSQMLFNAALTHIRLQVPVQQLVQAKEVLLKHKNGDFEQALKEEFNLVPVVCRQCGSTEIIQKQASDALLISAVMAYFSGVATKPITYSICKHCKAKISD